MADFYLDMRDVRFCLFDQMGVESLSTCDRYRDQSRETWELVLSEAEKLARDVLFPLSAPFDEAGVRFEDGKVYLPEGAREAFKAYAEGGWIALNQGPKYGGMGLPNALAVILTEIFTAANPSFMMLPGLALSASRVISELAGEALADIYVEKMNLGVWGGTMCLTEPQAGSAVGDLRTMATPVDGQPGVYKVVGNKIFISMGKQDLTENIIHLVLARTPDAPAGTRGLSLFIVPEYRVNDDGSVGAFNDVRCTGVEEKMGIHASPTCSMSFGDDGDCFGWIVGGEGEGMRHMFQMMNEARLAVGAQGSATANLAYLTALNYAKERIQGVSVENFKDPEAPRVPIVSHPNVRAMLMEARALAEGSRSLIIATATWADRAETATDDKDRERWTALAEIFTPICKAYASDAGFRVTDLAMQVHGGYGYIREYGVEQYMRDVKIAAIYEGTNGIQALDLLSRKVARKGGKDFMTAIAQIDRLIREHKEHPVFGAAIGELNKAKNTLMQTTMLLGQYQAKRDFAYPVLNAKSYLQMFGHVALAWMLLEQAVLAHAKAERLREEDPSRTPDSHPELRYCVDKGHTARFFVARVLPQVHGIATQVQSGDTSALEALF